MSQGFGEYRGEAKQQHSEVTVTLTLHLFGAPLVTLNSTQELSGARAEGD